MIMSFLHVLYCGYRNVTYVNVVTGNVVYYFQVHTIIQTTFPQSYIDGLRKRGFHIIEHHLPSTEDTFSSPPWKNAIKNIIFDGDMSASIALGYLSINYCARDCEFMLISHDFMDSLKSLQFDIALIDGFPLAPCIALIPHLLDIPFVTTSGAYLPSTTSVPTLPSFVPLNMMTKGFTDKMTFVERLQNFVTFFASIIFDQPVGSLLGTTVHLLHKHAPEYSSWDQLRKNALLMILTRDHHLEYIAPSMPHIVQVPGLSYKPARQLPGELQEAANEAGKGIIVFTMGSSIGEFPLDVFDKFISAFAQIPETVFMRYSGNTLSTTIPSNVHIRSWLPQNDLLGHNDTKLFITHGGNNGQYEAAYHGVPMITFPVFADQHSNAKRVEYKKLGLCMELRNFNADELVSNIQELINNPIYRSNAKKVSAMLKDRPMSPAEESAYWIEQVMKFGGDHLRSHALNMPWYTLYMADILGAAICVCFIILCLMYMMIKVMYSKFISTSTKVKAD